MIAATNTFLAIFVGSKTSPQMAAWNGLPEAERLARQQEGLAAWKAWLDKHQAAIISIGGPLGRTKRVSRNGVADTANEIGGYTLVRAGSHEEAARLFENHPHFANFPGEAVEVMPVLPIPGT